MKNWIFFIAIAMSLPVYAQDVNVTSTTITPSTAQVEVNSTGKSGKRVTDFVLYYVNLAGLPYGFDIVLTHEETGETFYFESDEDTRGELGVIPEGEYNITIYLNRWAAFEYS